MLKISYKTFPRTHNGETVPIDDRLEFANLLFTNDKPISDDYKYLDRIPKEVMAIIGGEMKSMVPDFYNDLRKHEAKIDIFANEKKRKRRIRSNTATCDWYLNYFPCCLASNYLHLNDDGQEDGSPSYDDSSLFRKFYDGSHREVKKPGRDRRTKEWREWLSEQSPDVLEMIDHANKNRSKTYKEWAKGSNPFDELSDYTWRAREYSITSVNGGNADKENYSDYDFAECEAYEKRTQDYSSTTTENIAANRMELERLNQFIDMLENNIDKTIVEMLLDGYKHNKVYECLGMKRSTFYARLERIKKFFYPIVHKDKCKSLSPETKTCIRCKSALSIDYFGNDKRRSDGKQSVCRRCDSGRKKTGK